MWPDRLGKTLAAAHREDSVIKGGQVCRARPPIQYSAEGLTLDRDFPQRVYWVKTPHWLI